MQAVQFMVPGTGRRVGVIQNDKIIDVTSGVPECQRIINFAQRAFALSQPLSDLLQSLCKSSAGKVYSYAELLKSIPGSNAPHLLPPVDHSEPSRLLITGTGLTHLGSVQSRDQMHGGTQSEVPQTDSARMFAMGLEGGRPKPEHRGTAPEWFFKGTGHNLRGHREPLEIPGFALDGGEEPEIVGCYAVDPKGNPRRLGFVLGNEWSDHATEKINYLYLAPSKLRVCSIGPSLQITEDFSDISLRCTVTRQGKTLYDSGELRSGEKNMCHSLRNLEDHHFKYLQHRIPGDVHLHFFGTSKLSYGSRTWRYEPGDEIRIDAPGFSESLVNPVTAGSKQESEVFIVHPA